MQLTEEKFKEFEQIWHEENPGKEVSRDQLFEAANKLLRVVNLIYGSDDTEGMELQ